MKNYTKNILLTVLLLGVSTSTYAAAGGAGSVSEWGEEDSDRFTTGAAAPKMGRSQYIDSGYLRAFKNLRPEDGTDFLYYNTYPFNLPDDREKANTIVLSPDATPEAAMGNAEISTIIRNDVEQFVIRDFPDLAPLAALGVAKGVPGALKAKAYAFHVFGGRGNAVVGLLGVMNLLRGWGDPSEESTLAYCDRLDVAVSGLTSENRGPIIDSLRAILTDPSAKRLETLSLRFMGLTNEDLATIAGALGGAGAGNSLKRLVLSFNDIDEGAFGVGGVLGNIIGDVGRFPELFVVDVRGNRIVNPSAWNININVSERCEHLEDTYRLPFVLRLGYNQEDGVLLTRDLMDHNDEETAFVTPSTDLVSPPDFPAWGTQRLKDYYHNGTGGICLECYYKKLSPQDLSEHPFENLCASLFTPGRDYKDNADLMLLLQMGKHNFWNGIDLTGRVLDHGDVADLLSFVRKPFAIEKLILDNVFARGGVYDPKIHDRVVESLNRFVRIKKLSMANNHLLAVPKAYNKLMIFPDLHSFDFSGNRLGFGIPEDEHGVPSAVAHENSHSFLRSLLLGVSSMPNIRELKLANNVLNEANFGALLAILSAGWGKLNVVDLSGNQLRLVTPITPESNTGKLFSRLEKPFPAAAAGGAGDVAPRMDSRPLVLLDMTKNDISEGDSTVILNEYKRRSALLASTNPVLKLNGRKVDGTFTGPREIGSGRAFLSSAKGYEQYDDAAKDSWKWIRSPDLPMAEEHIVRAHKIGVDARFASILALEHVHVAYPLSGDDLPVLDAGDAALRVSAQAYFTNAGIPADDAAVTLHARLYKHYKNNGSVYNAEGEGGREAKIRYFKTLPLKEQKFRVKEVLGERSGAVTTPMTRSNAEIFDSVLARLFNEE